MNNLVLERLILKSRELYELPQSSFKHFSYIMDNKRIVSMGWNFSKKTHPLAHRFGYKFMAIHSELHAIKNFPFPVQELRHFKLVNVRIGINKEVRISRPCICCLRLLDFFGIDEVWFTNKEGRFEKL